MTASFRLEGTAKFPHEKADLFMVEKNGNYYYQLN